MQRRKFIRHGLVTGTASLAGYTFYEGKNKPEPNASTPFHLNYAIHDGMFRNNAGTDFINQIQFAYDNGFRAIEDNGMMDRPEAEQKKIGAKLEQLGMSMGVFVVSFDHWPLQTSLTSGKADWKSKFLQYCKNAVEVAKRCGAKWMTVVPGNYDTSLPIGFQTANVIEVLKHAAAIFEPEALVMVLEPLSDTPDLFLRYSDQAFAICEAVNSPSCKILFDMYHMQRNEGNLIGNMDRAWEHIAYFQIGDNPGRKEPGTGEVNYKNVFQHIYQRNYKGVLGMEHGNAKPGKTGEMGVIKAYRDCDNFAP